MLSSFTYTYYLDGNVRHIAESMGGVTRQITYSYSNDAGRRLISERSTGGGIPEFTRTYQYDARGNRTRMTVTGGVSYVVNYTYD